MPLNLKKSLLLFYVKKLFPPSTLPTMLVILF